MPDEKQVEEGNRSISEESNKVVKALVLGCTVKIKQNNSVKVRVAHLISKQGVVTEVPTHPNTWYTVEFEGEPKPTKFQATALIPLGENGEELVPSQSNNSDSMATTEDSSVVEGDFYKVEKSKYSSLPSLADKDPNLFVGKYVIIKSGSMAGHFANVIRTGNGWVQLNVVGRNGNNHMVAKRAYELLVPAGRELEQIVEQIKADRPSEKDSDDGGKENTSTNSEVFVGSSVLIKNGSQEGNVGIVVSTSNGYYSIETNGCTVRKRSGQIEVVNSAFGKAIEGKMISVLSSQASGTIIRYDAGRNTYKVKLEDAAKSHSVSMTLDLFRVVDESSSAKEDSQTDNGQSENSKDERSSVKARSNRRQQRAQRRAKSKYSKSNAKSSNQNLTKLQQTQRDRRELMVQYVNRALERVYEHTPHRPNLKEYLDRIQYNSEDEEQEEDSYTPPISCLAFCKICLLEKIKDDDKCWNPACWKSPVYEPGAMPISFDALPTSKGRKGVSSFFAVAQSPRKAGFIDVPEFSFPTVDEQKPVAPSKFTAGLKEAEEKVVTSPLVTYDLRAERSVLGQRKRPRQPPREKGLDGYFGRGWMYGNSSDEDHRKADKSLAGLWTSDKDDETVKLEDAARTSLDFRWRSWQDEELANSKASHPTLSGAAHLMTFSTAEIASEESKELDLEKDKIQLIVKAKRKRAVTPPPPAPVEKPRVVSPIPEEKKQQPEKKKPKVVAPNPPVAAAPAIPQSVAPPPSLVQQQSVAKPSSAPPSVIPPAQKATLPEAVPHKNAFKKEMMLERQPAVNGKAQTNAVDPQIQAQMNLPTAPNFMANPMLGGNPWLQNLNNAQMLQQQLQQLQQMQQLSNFTAGAFGGMNGFGFPMPNFGLPGLNPGLLQNQAALQAALQQMGMGNQQHQSQQNNK